MSLKAVLCHFLFAFAIEDNVNYRGFQHVLTENIVSFLCYTSAQKRYICRDILCYRMQNIYANNRQQHGHVATSVQLSGAYFPVVFENSFLGSVLLSSSGTQGPETIQKGQFNSW